MSVPRIFHRVWLADGAADRVPPAFEAYWQRLKVLHPRWKFRSWESAAELRPMLRNLELFDSFTEFPAAYASRSDVARYEILAKFGGVYVDTDVEPLRPFDELLTDGRPFAAWCSAKELDPAVIASPAHHPAIEVLVDELETVHRWLRAGGKGSPPGTTGPHFLTAHWRWRPDVVRLPPITFFPYHFTGEPYAPWPRESLAVHRWNAGWRT